MKRILQYLITPETQGISILAFLRRKGFSGSILSSMKALPDAVLYNGRQVSFRTVLTEGDSLLVTVPENRPGEDLRPLSVRIPILLEDEDLLVVNKPADMPVHPSPGNYENTLANWAAFHFRREKDFVFRCVNRLDRDTTGAVILAKNPLSAAILSREIKERQIHRTYLAIVKGVPPEKGTIRAPIARKEGSVLEREVNFQKGQPAVTHFQRLAVKQEYSLLELHLDTGRTHQIRVHMKYLGYPLPGDYLYCPDHTGIKRQALHSFQVEFPHPITEETVLLTAPVPEDFRNAWYFSRK
ncbi:MAG: RluA family pseudouridine synthase [Clostridiales bacterium]|nr:RluA family pseudouridine synthase [Clostridiales bacterium]